MKSDSVILRASDNAGGPDDAGEGLARAALDHLGHPVLIIDAGRRILLANAAAGRMLARRGGPFAGKTELQSADAEINRRLNKAVLAAIAGSGDAFVVPGRDGHIAARVIVSAMPDHGAAFVMVEAPAHDGDFAGRLVKLYGLSPAEIALAEALLRGETLEIFATARGVRMTTARSQLSSLLRKTDTERQSQLIASLARLPRLDGQDKGA